MSAPVKGTKSQAQTAHPQFEQIKERIEMKLANLSKKLNIRYSAPAKILGGIALGAMLMTATILPLGLTHADEPAKPLVNLVEVFDHDLEADYWALVSPSVVSPAINDDLEEGYFSLTSVASPAINDDLEDGYFSRVTRVASPAINDDLEDGFWVRSVATNTINDDLEDGAWTSPSLRLINPAFDHDLEDGYFTHDAR